MESDLDVIMVGTWRLCGNGWSLIVILALRKDRNSRFEAQARPHAPGGYDVKKSATLKAATAP